MRIVLHPTADSELTEAVSYYAEIDPPARRHFNLSFPYGIIYLEQEDRIWVVAVMHMKRDPGYWKSRLD